MIKIVTCALIVTGLSATKMRFKCWGRRSEMKLSKIAIVFTLLFACAYASRNDSSSLDAVTQHPPVKHRTARLVREFPNSVEQRLQSIEYPSYNIPNPYGPGTYAFGYEIEDPQTGNVQFRDEEKLQNGTVRGSYGYMQPDGSVIITRFLADLLGYRATTEIRRADGQTVASFPGRSPITYNPALNPDYINPQYSAAILSHIKNQQFNPNQGLIQYPNGIPPTTPFPLQDYPINPTGPLPYDAPMNGNIFSNFFNQFPSNLIPSNIYNNLHSTFPNIIPQQNPLNTFATNIQNGIQQFTQNNPLGNFVSNAQTQFQQNNPFANWFNGNRFGQQQQQQQQIQQSPQLFLQSQQQQSLPGVGFSGLTGLGASNYLQNHRIPTTKRRRIIGTTKRRMNHSTANPVYRRR
ncbi:AAEL011501-PA [Aedes aegypti]|uniref:AAEL011501-PA n=1 Tax=Aedes aegypti TaxID=7159 RepID=Q16PW7_AEDAE|nr:AAEL011501-PA [Aedes aegypti]